jgi:hypothetical protein
MKFLTMVLLLYYILITYVLGEFLTTPRPSNSYKTILPISFMMFMVIHIKYNGNHRSYDGEKVIAVKNENYFQNTFLKPVNSVRR